MKRKGYQTTLTNMNSKILKMAVIFQVEPKIKTSNGTQHKVTLIGKRNNGEGKIKGMK